MDTDVRELFLTPREQDSNYGHALWCAIPRAMPECHQHNDVEVNFLTQGHFTYLHAGRFVPLRTGDLAVFWAARPHQVVELSERPYFKGISVPLGWFLSRGIPGRLKQEILDGEMVLGHGTLIGERFGVLLDRWCDDIIEDSAERRTVMLLEIEGWFRRLGLELDERGRRPLPGWCGEQGNSLAKVEKMARFVNEHYREPLTVVDVAEFAGLHPNYAVKLFREKTGSTLIDFILSQRVAHAQRLLTTTDANVKEIAIQAGFGSLSRFYATFKDTLGMSPREYRAMIRRPREMG